MSNKGRLILVRHGQTAANIDKVWHGTTNTALTELGQQQAKKLGSYFHQVMTPDVIYASPLQRAHHTAEAIAQNHSLTVNLDSRLQEFGLGDWEGVSFKDLSRTYDTERKIFKDPDFLPPNGESVNMVRKRMVAAIDEIVTRHEGENVVVVSHGAAMGIALSYYLHQDTSKWIEYHHDNTAYSELSHIERRLVFFNQADHI